MAADRQGENISLRRVNKRGVKTGGFKKSPPVALCLKIVAAAPLLSALSPAAAQAGLYNYSGKLEWKFENVSVKTPSGRTSTSMGAHAYSLNLDGPLGSPLLGTGNMGLSFQKGKNLSQVVTAGNSSQEIFGYNFGATLLPPALRRFITLSPNFSKSRNSTSWGDGALHDITDTVSGVTMGLTLPKLPAYTVTYQKLRRKDDSYVATNQETEVMDERAVYMKGVLRAEYQRRRQKTRDLFGNNPDSSQDTVNSNVDLNDSDFNKMGLRSYFLRVSYVGQTNESIGKSEQKGVSTSLNLASKSVKVGKVDSYLGYLHTVSRNLVSQEQSSNGNLTLFSSYSGNRKNVNNQLQVRSLSGANGADYVASENLSSDITILNGFVNHRFQGVESLKWGASGSGGTDLAEQRLSIFPAQKYDFYVDQRYSASRSAAAGAQSQTLGWGGGANWRPNDYARGNLNFQRDANSDLQTAKKTFTDAVSVKFSAEPTSDLSTSLAYAVYMSDAFPVSSRNDTLSLDASYSLLPGLSLSGTLYRAGNRQHFALGGNDTTTASLDYNIKMLYGIGRTTVSLLYESRETSVFNAYGRFGAFLSRSF